MEAFDPVSYINDRRWQYDRNSLERIGRLLERMGRPHERLKFVHVAGTNGKGSTSAYMASILRCAGYRTGLFTSPHIVDFHERIRIDGRDISDEDLLKTTLFVRDHASAFAAQAGEHPTEFELMCAVAFEHFARSSCDIVVCEVGRGGRTDPTNVIEACELSVICRIGLDHVDVLGNTLAQIAGEKAGIIKHAVPVVAYPQDDAGAMQAIVRAAAAKDAPLSVADFARLETKGLSEKGIRSFSYKEKPYTTRMVGTYQPYNAALAIEAAATLAHNGWKISDAAVGRGIAEAYWPGRFEILEWKGRVLVIDGAHNEQGAAALDASLEDVFAGRNVVFVMGVLADKAYRDLVGAVVSRAKAFVCIAPDSSRSLSTGDLAHVVARVAEDAEAGAKVEVREAASLADGLDAAAGLCEESDIVCVFGSLYLVGEAKSLVG